MSARLKLGTRRIGLDDEGFIFDALQDINLAPGVSDFAKMHLSPARTRLSLQRPMQRNSFSGSLPDPPGHASLISIIEAALSGEVTI